MDLGPDTHIDNLASSEPKGTLEIMPFVIFLVLQKREERPSMSSRVGTWDVV